MIIMPKRNCALLLAAALLALPAGQSRSEDNVDFVTQILPVLEARCMECHRTPYEDNGRMRRPRGGLIMDTAAGMLEGGSSGDVLIPGDAAASYLVEVVHLPEDDDMFMPPNRDPLTEEERELLTRWVNEGAGFGDWETSTWEQIEARMREFDPAADDGNIYDRLAGELEPVGADIIAEVEAVGARVSRLAQGSPLLRVDFLNARDAANEDALAAVAKLGPNLVQLELGRTVVTDAALAHLAELPNLVRLDLHQTGITDAAMPSLAHLGHLEYLNLYATKVTDEGLGPIAGLESLQSLYLWQSEVTADGVAALQGQRPELRVIAE